MTDETNSEIAKSVYAAFSAGDRDAIERLMADDLTFSSPYDVGLDRAGYFERCWPGSGHCRPFDFERVIESGDQVIVTYVGTKEDGTRFRNTEVLTISGEQVHAVEVYFGWNLG